MFGGVALVGCSRRKLMSFHQSLKTRSGRQFFVYLFSFSCSICYFSHFFIYLYFPVSLHHCATTAHPWLVIKVNATVCFAKQFPVFYSVSCLGEVRSLYTLLVFSVPVGIWRHIFYLSAG